MYIKPQTSIRTNKYMSSEIILDTSKFYTTRPHTQTHLQAGERWTSKFKLKQLCISNRRHLIRLCGWRRLYNDMAKKVWRVMMAKNHRRAMTRKTLQLYCRWTRKACHWCWLRHRRVLRENNICCSHGRYHTDSDEMVDILVAITMTRAY